MFAAILTIRSGGAMRCQPAVHLGNLMLSLSDSMDLAAPSLFQHQLRTAFIVWQMGKAADIAHERLEKIFSAALVHDIGAFSLEEKILIRNNEVANVDDHCLRGEILLSNIPCLKTASEIIRFHHTEYQKWGESIENPIVFESQLLFLADHLERHLSRDQYILDQYKDIISQIRSCSGSLFHPQVIDLFLTVSKCEEFWLDLVSPRLYSHLLDEGPFRNTVDFSSFIPVSELLRNIVDFRSRFTSTHSSGVSACASILAKLFGLTETETGLMEIAGNLHDIGKLGIPNSILNKPEKLSSNEMAVMKSHPYHTYRAVVAAGGLKEVAQWAAYHHERLDGSGYPFHCKAAELNIGSRIIMIADIFTALTEDRPYRRVMTKEICRIMKQLSDDHKLDGRIVDIILEDFNEISSFVYEKQSVARDFYEKHFSMDEAVSSRS